MQMAINIVTDYQQQKNHRKQALQGFRMSLVVPLPLDSISSLSSILANSLLRASNDGY